MGILDLLDFKPRRRKKQSDAEELIANLGLSANPDESMARFLMKMERAHQSAGRYAGLIHDWDPAGLTTPDYYPRGKTPPPGKYGVVNDPSDPWKKKRQI